MNNAFATDINDVEERCRAGYYDYIIIGSGMGGGTLARNLIGGDDGIETENSPRVLVIERGGLRFSTHCMNTPTPGWYQGEGPSMSTDIVFQSSKSPVNIATGNSVPYVGGPVYCLGGRSNVWGMYTPPLHRKNIADNFGGDIANYLFENISKGEDDDNLTGYERAYKLLSHGDDLKNPYPLSRGPSGIKTPNKPSNDKNSKSSGSVKATPDSKSAEASSNSSDAGTFETPTSLSSFDDSISLSSFDGSFNSGSIEESTSSGSIEDPMTSVTESIRSILHEFDTMGGSNYFNLEPDPLDKTRRFSVCPMGAEFLPREPQRRLYQTVTGGYSAVTWMLERCYNNSQALTVLLNTQVMGLNYSSKPRNITGITVLDPDMKNNQYRTILVGGSTKVILSCGTIDTAALALRSRLDKLGSTCTCSCTPCPWIGAGLTDHDIWGVRFDMGAKEGVPYLAKRLSGQALRVQSWVRLHSSPPWKETSEACLVNITINAASFLGTSSIKGSLTMFLDLEKPNEIITKKEFDAKFGAGIEKLGYGSHSITKRASFREAATQYNSTDSANGTGEPSNEYERFSLQVVFEFGSSLQDDNKVLNIPRSTPTIEIPNREDKRPYLNSMRRFAYRIALMCGQWENTNIDSTSTEEPIVNVVPVERASFGVVAHEVGTMRMQKPKSTGVVDTDLKFNGLDNLYVCDLSVFPWSPAANPSLTLVALAQRLADHLESERQRSTGN
ncbi:hypothetical protein TWF718_006704 [Orbilia javanica]|uniref:Glucose-methanol-choline oxidoreductase C-terminal domain-containing protein n=1 Tax=Orbilia javanica TaxID=47235 RepID=A0AAN8MYU5_9PEZI